MRKWRVHTFAPHPRALRAACTLPRVRAVALLIAAILLAVVFAMPATAQAAEDDTVGISLRPADETGAFDDRTNFRYAADPGQTILDHAAVVNTGTEAQVFTLIGTDAFNDAAGDYALLPTDADPELIGRWIRFENGTNRMQVTLQPGEGRLVPFRVALPADATPGDHAGGIVASVLTDSGQVDLDRRVAVRLYTRVSGDLHPRLTISSIEASYHGDWWNLLTGTVRVHYTLDNTGNVALAANYKATTKTWFGIPLTGQATGSTKELLPGNTATYEVEIPGIAQWGFLNPVVAITPFVDNDDPSTYVTAAPSERDTWLAAVPWDLVLLLGLGGLVWLGLRWRRQVDIKRAEEWIAYTEAEAKRKAEAERELTPAGSPPQSGGS